MNQSKLARIRPGCYFSNNESRNGADAGLTLLAIWAIRRARIPATTGLTAAGEPAARAILQHQTSQTPADILKARYPHGEISREEYEQMQRDLEG